MSIEKVNFKEKEIRDILSGRRALSKTDVAMVLSGTYSPENIPNFKKDSAVANAIKNINRELGTNYTTNDFINREKLLDIRRSYLLVPLGLSEEDREEFLRSTPKRKGLELQEKIKDRIDLMKDQKPPKKPQAQLPAADFLPDPQIANLFAANVNQTTGLTDTETALLSPEEQIIARRLRT